MVKGKEIVYSLIAAAAVTVLTGAGVLQRVDRWMQDGMFQRPGVTSSQIAIIGIDEEALSALGPYQTWDRNIMASALEALAAEPDKKPAVTAIDVLYVGETEPEADLRLANAAAELGNVVTACLAEYGEQVTWENGRAAAIDTSAVVSFAQPFEAMRQCTTQGHINAMSDADGVVRHGLLYVEPAFGRVWSMSRVAAQMFAAQQGADEAGGSAGAGVADAGGSVGAGVADAGGDAGDSLFYIPYTGRPGDFYDGVSIARLIRGEIPADYWAGKIVLIGPYAAALQDAYFTPIEKGEQMYGVEIQANMIQSFLENNVKKEIAPLPQLAVLFVLCAAAMLLFLNMEVLPASLLGGSMAAMWPVCAMNLYLKGFVTHPLWGPTGVAVIYILAMMVHYVRAVRERQVLALEKERVGAELALASRIQNSALPKEFPSAAECGPFDIFASMTPAKEVGGDFYDFFMIDGEHLGMVIADVSDKGVPAALFMMVASALIRSAAEEEYSPGRILQTVNRRICARNPEEMFVTVWLGILEVKTGKLTAANAGHEYPVLKRADGHFELYKDRHGLVVGAMDGVRYRDYELQLEPGAKLFVYTDGLAEAANGAAEQFGTERIVTALRSREDGTPEEILAAVNAAVQAFVDDAPQFDDLTMLCLAYK